MFIWLLSGCIAKVISQPSGIMGSSRKSYTAVPADYKLLEEVGYGTSSTVYRAVYLPTNTIVAVKCLDLDRCSINLVDIRKEAHTISMIDHPNVAKAYCSFIVERSLWIVMPFMAEGSCLHLMKIAYPDGFEESIIGYMLKETLKALEYLHRHGHIHRDVKAGNILLDNNGAVKLGDFGVSACLFDKGERQRSRNAFIDTPCWMAPEVLQPGSVQDFKADIWSFGVTALELAHGPASFSKYPPMKVLLMTIQDALPGLNPDRTKRLSKSFKEMVAMCLVKDQTKRPTAEKLLKHSFFKRIKPPGISVKSIVADLPPLWDRVKALQLKDSAQLALKQKPYTEEKAFSQSLYNHGVGRWNFDVEDLEALLTSIHDDGNNDLDDDVNAKHLGHDKEPYTSKLVFGKSISTEDLNCRCNRENESTLGKSQRPDWKVSSFSGPLSLPNCASGNSLSAPLKSSGGFKDAVDEKTKGNAVQVKGRFSITSERREPAKGSPLRKSASVGDCIVESHEGPLSKQSKETCNTGIPTSILLAHLQNLVQQTAFQQDLIMNLLNDLQQNDVVDASKTEKLPNLAHNSESEIAADTLSSQKETLLLLKIAELQARLSTLVDELAVAKLKHVQLQQLLNATEIWESDGCM